MVAAEKAFKFYKNFNTNNSYDEIQQCNKEFTELQNNIMQHTNGNSLSYKDFGRYFNTIYTILQYQKIINSDLKNLKLIQLIGLTK